MSVWVRVPSPIQNKTMKNIIKHKIDVKDVVEFTNEYGWEEAEIWKSKNDEFYEYRVGPMIQSGWNNIKPSLSGIISEDRFEELKPMFK